MMNKDEGQELSARLRWRAEEIIRGERTPDPEAGGAFTPDGTRRTIHELRVHQVELKMQNDELRRTLAELDATRARYFDLYDLAPVGYCVVSQEGLILEANLTAVELFGLTRAALVKQPITRFIVKEDQDVYYLHRKEFLKTGKPHACELRMTKNDGTTLWMRLTAVAAQAPWTGPGTGSALVSRVVLSDISDRKQVEEEKSLLEVQLHSGHRQHPIRSRTLKGKRG